MSFETVEGTLNISCTMVMTTALAAILLLIGFWLRKKVSFLTKYCIPAPVVGGFLFMFITFAGHQSGAFAFKLDTTFQSPFMVAFFTTVGLGASLSLLKKGGHPAARLLADCRQCLHHPELHQHRPRQCYRH
ncbi:sodium/glutamate symporter [Selenomonas ruminantium]|uniref:sodium/glutamate symporter n=1 Tax=Selenomonas ruminantium TaxID=971 RepID=UPI0026EBEB0B|nr:sodium/glutamate symporter [Selenomonas ruminantium]